MRNQAPSIKDRNRISKKMTPAEIARAEELVREWKLSTQRAKDQIRTNVKENFDKGVAAAKRHDNESAVRYFSLAIKSGELPPRYLVQAFSNRGIAYSRMGRHDEAIKDSNKAIQLMPEFHTAYIGRAIAYRAAQRYQLALNDIETARRLRGPGMPVFYHMGWTFYEMGQFDRAIEAFSSGLRFQPDYAAAYYKRGQSYEAKGDLQHARQDFKKAYELWPNDPDIQNKMRELGLLGQAASTQVGLDEAQAAFKRGDYETALREFRPLAEEGDARAQHALGVHYMFGYGVPRDFTQAFKWFQRAARHGHAVAKYDLGLMYYRGEGIERNFPEAFKWFFEAAEQSHAPAQYYVGLSYSGGQGVSRDLVEAARWMHRAAEAGQCARPSQSRLHV